MEDSYRLKIRRHFQPRPKNWKSATFTGFSISNAGFWTPQTLMTWNFIAKSVINWLILKFCPSMSYKRFSIKIRADKFLGGYQYGKQQGLYFGRTVDYRLVD